MAFDGIVTKAICSELQNLVGGRIDKIFEPNKQNIVIGIYSNFNNYALNICTEPQNYRISLTTHPRSNPKVAPNFCMVLRKHLTSMHIKNIITSNLERVITIELEGFDDIDDIISKKLIIELMGKHCNIILTDEQNVIIDSLKHITNENSYRTILPHHKYEYLKSDKLNFEDYFDFENFKSTIYAEINPNIDNIASIISSKFNGISKSFVIEIIDYLNITNLDTRSLKDIHSFIKEVIFDIDSLNLNFKEVLNNNKLDYFLIPCNDNSRPNIFNLNFFIDDFYYKKETNEEFKIYRNSILKLILNVLKKYEKRLNNINKKLKKCDNIRLFKLYGELLTSNLYKFNDLNNNLTEVSLSNYYDNNNLITIPLDKRYNISENAKLYYKKYNKLKNTLNVVTLQKQETIKELNYIQSIVYELENSTSIEDVASIFEEISENVVFKEKTDNYKYKKKETIKKSSFTKNKNVSFNPIKYKIGDFTLLVGRNNKENDYLTLKFAKKSDIWFHTKDFHGSHAILQIEKHLPSEDILIKCAEISAYYSKARDSSNVPVDYCQVKYVKKPNGSKPGMVIYTNNKTLYVNPKN